MELNPKSLIKIFRGNSFTHFIQRAKLSTLTFAKSQGVLKKSFPLKELRRSLHNRLSEVPLVEIPDDGEFRFMLLLAYHHGESGLGRLIVRGANTGQHSSIVKLAIAEAKAKDLCLMPKGGGTMKHAPHKKVIQIFGKCKDYGKANRDDVQEILLKKYRGYVIRK